MQLFFVQIPILLYSTMKTFNPTEFKELCHLEHKRIAQLPYTEQFEQSFTYCGKQYYFDPDFNCFFPITPWEERSHWDKYSIFYMTAILTAWLIYATH